MGSAQSHHDDGAPPPSRHTPSNRFERHSMGVRPVNTHRAPVQLFEPANPMTGMHPTLQRVETRNPIQQSSILSNVVNLHKQSLRMIPVSTHTGTDDAPVHSRKPPTKFLLQFDFDAQVDGFVTVYFCAQQVIHRVNGSTSPDASIVKVSYVTKGDRLSGKTPFVVNSAEQTYRQNEAMALDVSQFSTAELQSVQNERYPVVIRLEAKYPEGSQVPLHERIISQTTFAILEKRKQEGNGNSNGNSGGDAYVPKVVAQQVLINGTIYKLLELYGIGGRNVTASVQGNGTQIKSYNIDAGDECVVCLTEPCTIAVEPCYHLCLCEDCANTLISLPDRNMRKCPVCRSEIVRLLPLVPPQPQSEEPPQPTTVSGSAAAARPKPSVP